MKPGAPGVIPRESNDQCLHCVLGHGANGQQHAGVREAAQPVTVGIVEQAVPRDVPASHRKRVMTTHL